MAEVVEYLVIIVRMAVYKNREAKNDAWGIEENVGWFVVIHTWRLALMSSVFNPYKAPWYLYIDW